MSLSFSWKQKVSAVLGVALLGCSLAVQAKPTVLRGITPWNADYDMSQAFMLYRDMVNERLKGKLEIRYLGGPEVVQPNLQLDALKNGVVDIVLTAAAYYRGEVPGASAVMFTSKSPSELRKSGYASLMQEIHKEKGIQYMGNAAGGKKYRLYLNKKIDKPDLSGMTIRVSPVYLPLVQALGGNPVSISPSELYTALERNVVQGYGWPETGTIEMGLQETTKYVLDHSFYSLDTAVLMNQSVYEKLPEDVKKELDEITIEWEIKVEELLRKKLAEENQRLTDAGLEFIRFSDEDATAFLDTVNKAGWEAFVAQNESLFKEHPDFIERHQALGH